MKFTIQITAVSDDNEIISESEVISIGKAYTKIENIGLSILESKNILHFFQQYTIDHQLREYLKRYFSCDECGKKMNKKGHNTFKFRTLFGKINIKNPRFYYCDCQDESEVATFSPLTKLFTEKTSPELLYFESKWASIVSYKCAEKILKDFFPVDKTLNSSSIRLNTLKVAEQCEEKLGEEKIFFASGCQLDWDALPEANDPITVGIDGAYVKKWKYRKKNFEIIAGKSIPGKGPAKYFGLTVRYDQKPKRRIYDVLKSQNMQQNQEIVFLSDGEEALWNIQEFINPNSIFVLDWFHITMRITVLNQFIKGMIHVDEKAGMELKELLTSTKWSLWHGKIHKALDRFETIIDYMYYFEKSYKNFKKFEKLVLEFDTYIRNNHRMIPNYCKAYNAGYPISTAFVESTVNNFIAKRFAKKQQMQWSEKGVHLLIQVRAKVFNHELTKIFKDKYPEFLIESGEEVMDEKVA